MNYRKLLKIIITLWNPKVIQIFKNLLLHSRSSAAIKTILAPHVRKSRCRQCCRTSIPRQNKQITKGDSAEVNAGMSTKLIQINTGSRHDFCNILYITRNFSPPVATGGPHMATTKCVMATAVATGGAAIGGAVATGGLPWLVSTGW